MRAKAGLIGCTSRLAFGKSGSEIEAARVRSEPRIGCTRDSSESTWRRLIRRAAHAALALAAPNSNLEGQNHSTLSTRVRLDYNRPPLSLLGLETARGSETARTPVRGVQVLDLRNLRRGDALEDELLEDPEPAAEAAIVETGAETAEGRKS